MVTKSLDPNALASATAVTFKQQIQNTGALARDEKILVIGSVQTDKEIVPNTIKQFNNADDVAIMYGFGSPLHRMGMKVLKNAKVPVYFTAVDPATGSTAQVTHLTVNGSANRNFTAYLRFNELPGEAVADVVGRIATGYQLNPAKAPRKTELDVFNQVKVPFTILKHSTAKEILNNLLQTLNEYLEVPFTATLTTLTIEGEGEGNTVTKDALALTAKWQGSTASFTVDLVDAEDKVININDYGIAFETSISTESAGEANIQEVLDNLTPEYQFTRIVCQFNDENNLDRLQEKGMSLRDSLICQWVLAYTAQVYPESKDIKGTVDISKLVEFGDKRRADAVNVIIAGDYGSLRSLTYLERDQLLKAGISNLEARSEGGYRIGDLVTLYHPIGQKNPLFRYDRDITLIGNIGYDLMTTFRDSEAWKSIIIVADDLVTNNDSARSPKDIKAELDTRLRLYGNNAWIADVDKAINHSKVEIDNTNPNRINLNPYFELSGVGRIFDVTNFVGFYFSNQQ